MKTPRRVLALALTALTSQQYDDDPRARDGAANDIRRNFLLPTDNSISEVMEFLDGRPFVMLNRFRLREVADFSNHPEMVPATPTSTNDLFYQYIVKMDVYLEQVGAERIWLADGGPMLIGPRGERWDVVQMVRYPNAEALLRLGALVEAEVPVREVMLEDSRIMPMIDKPIDAVTEIAPE